MPLDPNNPFADLVPNGTPGVIQGPPKEPTVPANYEPDPTNPGAVRPIQGGPADPTASADSMDPQTIQFYAQQVLAGAPMPSLGMGKQASKNREQIMKGVATMAGAQGLSGADLARQIAHYKAQTENIKNLEKQIGTIEGNEKTALANGQQFIDRSMELPGQTETPLINSVVQSAQRNIGFVPGHETISAMDAAYNTFVNEYAKVVSGTPNGGGTLSDSARHEAMNTIRSNAGPAQKKAAFEQMRADMANRIAAAHKVINESYAQIGQKPGYEVPTDLGMFKVGDQKDRPGQDKLTPAQISADKNFTDTHPDASPDEYASFLTNLLGMANKKVTPEAAAARLEARRAGRPFNAGVEDKAYAQKVRDRLSAENKAGLGDSPVTTETLQGATAGLSDEASGVGNALAGVVAAPFTGKLDVVGDYRLGRDVERQRIEDARQQLGYGGSALEFAGGLASGRPGVGFSGLLPNLGRVSGREAVVAAGKGGAAGGAINGFGYGDGAEGSLTGAGMGALTGYALGRYAPAVVGKVASKVLPRGASPALAPEVAAAADAEGLSDKLIRPMVDPASRGKFGQLESNPVSQPIIRGAVNDMLSGIEARVKALGTGGVSGEADAIGDKVQQGGKNWLANRTTLKNRLYDKAEKIAGSARFDPQQAISEADAAIAELSGNPTNNKAEIDFLNGMKSDLSTPGGKTVSDIRNLREGLSASINRNGLTMDGAGVRALRVLNAAKADIQANVPDAAAAYGRADQYFGASQQIVDDLKAAVLGSRKAPLEPQVALQKLRNMMGNSGTGRRFARIMGALDPQSRQDVAATWAEALGRKAPDAPFSAGTFLEQTKSLSPSALRTAFGPEGAQSVKNLRVLSQALKDAGGDVNYTRSGSNVIRYMAQNFIARLTGLGAGAATGAVMGGAEGAGMGAAAVAGGAALSAGKSVLSARAMVDPKVSRWLADAVKVKSRSDAHAAMRKLSVIISRDPSLSSELQPIYDRISQAFSGTPTMPLAAQGDGEQNDQ